MLLRTLFLISSLCTIAITGMNNQQQLYVTSSDKEIILIPNHLIPYFITFQTMRENLGNQTDEHGGIPFQYHSAKALKFALRLAETLHAQKDINNLMGTVLFFDENEIAEMKELLEYLDSNDLIKASFAKLITQKKKLKEQAPTQDNTNDVNKISIAVGQNKTFTINKKIVPYMKALQDMLTGTAESMETIHVPANSPLAITNPDVFNSLIEILNIYDQMQSNEQAAAFNLQTVFDPIIKAKKKNTVQLIVNLLNLMNFLEVEVLYHPMLELVHNYIKNNSLPVRDLAWQNLNNDSMHLIKEFLIVPLMYDLQTLTMQTAKPETILKNVQGDSIIFAHSGHYACLRSNGDKSLTIVDLEKKQVMYTQAFDFKILHFQLDEDGSTVVIQRRDIGEEAATDQIYLFDIHGKKLSLTGCKLPDGQYIQTFALSPDKKKLCVATHENNIFICGENNFATILSQVDLSAQEALDMDPEDLECDYHITWFPNSLKCVINLYNTNAQNGANYIIGTRNRHAKLLHVPRNKDNTYSVTLPNSNSTLLRIQELLPLATITVESGDGANQIGEVIPFGLHHLSHLIDGFLSNTDRYILAIGEDFNYIIEIKTGYVLKQFNAVAPMCFNKNDTGAYEYRGQPNEIVFYPFRNSLSTSIENILYSLNFVQLIMVTNILNAIKNKQRIFKGFTPDEKKLLQAHIMQQGDIVIGLTSTTLKTLEQCLIELQKLYSEKIFLTEISSSDDDTSVDDE